ncbi:bifunctional helix-turn-helix domain-containing protein/methylated-DNA--[protein]-cysteine S-methyltransferase [Agaribacterium sp. ZY112]|uniref:bifunctional helix-turn-helix domain-containing protein/methylated-DNA--[protein]-cysteine S-methyltransferase n=1 Tax=Agaribacterium sp. ZY112 TaxID=3233574 RepID=UPI003523F211
MTKAQPLSLSMQAPAQNSQHEAKTSSNTTSVEARPPRPSHIISDAKQGETNSAALRSYTRIEKAIGFICEHFQEQPDLASIAAQAQLSPSHFQREFTNWVGLSPKQFVRFLSVEYAKQCLQKNRQQDLLQQSVLELAHQTGYSSASRLHDAFITLEAMTPGEYKNQGQQLIINYQFNRSLFGPVLIASTTKGVCSILFHSNKLEALEQLKMQFSKATFIETESDVQKDALALLQGEIIDSDLKAESLKLHLKASPFQVQVWKALLQIPLASLTSYGTLAKKINRDGAARAVGTAIGQNPIAFLIPCHRVIQASGKLGGYRWGLKQKRSIIGWEAAQHQTRPENKAY